MPLRKKRPEYKWVILAVCFCMEFACLGFCSSNQGLYLTAVTNALHIERSLFSFNTSVRHVVTAVVSVFLGSLIQKLGIRKLVFVGLCALSASMLTYAFAEELYQFYLGGALLGLGIALIGGTMAGIIVRRWFRENVGRYTGIAMAANGIGGAFAAQVVSPLINEAGNPFGYRNAYLLSALVTIGIGIVIILLLREAPPDVSDTVNGIKKKPRGDSWEGIPFSSAKKKPYFWLTAALILLNGICLQSVSYVTLAHLSDVGLGADFVAAMATLSSLVLTAAKVATGILYDKRGLPFTVLVCCSSAAVAFVLFGVLNSSALGCVFAVAACVLSMAALPMETVMLPLFANDLVGRAAYDKAVGLFKAIQSVGLCVGTPLGNLYYDMFGTYAPVFWVFAGLMLGVSIGFQIVLRMAKKERELCP